MNTIICKEYVDGTDIILTDGDFKASGRVMTSNIPPQAVVQKTIDIVNLLIREHEMYQAKLVLGIVK